MHVVAQHAYCLQSWQWSSAKSPDKAGSRCSAHRRIYSTVALAGCRRVARRRDANQLSTERLEKECTINARVGMRLPAVVQAILRKLRRLYSRKTIQYQWLTSSVLNPRSREVWRQTAGETEFRVSPDESQSGGLFAKPVVIGLLCALGSRRRMLNADGLAVGDGFEPSVGRPQQRRQPLRSTRRTRAIMRGCSVMGAAAG
jgi:hypothetical protein